MQMLERGKKQWAAIWSIVEKLNKWFFRWRLTTDCDCDYHNITIRRDEKKKKKNNFRWCPVWVDCYLEREMQTTKLTLPRSFRRFKIAKLILYILFNIEKWSSSTYKTIAVELNVIRLCSTMKLMGFENDSEINHQPWLRIVRLWIVCCAPSYSLLMLMLLLLHTDLYTSKWIDQQSKWITILFASRRSYISRSVHLSVD